MNLLTAEGQPIVKGQIFRAGITTILPQDLAPGRYVVVVDSSSRELSRDDGIYRLYVGLNSTGSGARVQDQTYVRGAERHISDTAPTKPQ